MAEYRHTGELPKPFCGEFLPSPDEIEELCVEFQKGWTKLEERRRRGGRRKKSVKEVEQALIHKSYLE